MSNIKTLNFEGLNRFLILQVGDLLFRWLPGGKLIGAEYCCGSLRGESGDSLKININTGKWADFASTERGGDLVSLYAAINDKSQRESYKELSTEFNFEQNGNGQETAITKAESHVVQPPVDVDISKPLEMFKHRDHGKPSGVWFYRNTSNEVLFAVARYESKKGKQILPWTWDKRGFWNCKGWPVPRPLFGLEYFKDYIPNSKKIMIVEGEKSAVAAREIAGEFYIVLTWPNGAQALDKADWSLIRDMIVLLWPDADEPGKKAMQFIAEKLANQGCKIKILDVDDKPDGWDAADALAEGMDWPKLKEWGSPKLKVYEGPTEIIAATAIAENQKNVATTQVNLRVNLKGDAEQISNSVRSIWSSCGLTATGSGPTMNMDTVFRLISYFEPLKNLVWFDEFYQRIFTTWRTGQRREWSDADDLHLLLMMQSDLGLKKIKINDVIRAVTKYAFDHTKNEPKDWFETLKWDEKIRLWKFFPTYFGADDTVYTNQAAANFWVGMVARIYQPGCKLDNMIVLEGPQGIGKSRSLAAIGGPWYTEACESVQSKDFYLMLRGKLLVEIAELDSFGKAEVTRIKQVISSPVDRYRAPYAHHTADNPRQSIFVGTTNEDAYLKDATGGRRFWPILTRKIDVEAIIRDREQFFAEAVQRLKQKDDWHRMPDKETKCEQKNRRPVDERQPIIYEYLVGKNQTTIAEIVTECLRIDIGEIHKHQQAVATMLRNVDFDNKDNAVTVKGVQRRIWTRSVSSESSS